MDRSGQSWCLRVRLLGLYHRGEFEVSSSSVAGETAIRALGRVCRVAGAGHRRWAQPRYRSKRSWYDSVLHDKPYNRAEFGVAAAFGARATAICAAAGRGPTSPKKY